MYPETSAVTVPGCLWISELLWVGGKKMAPNCGDLVTYYGFGILAQFRIDEAQVGI